MSREYESREALAPIVVGVITIVPHVKSAQLKHRGWVLPGGLFTRFAWEAKQYAELWDKQIKRGHSIG